MGRLLHPVFRVISNELYHSQRYFELMKLHLTLQMFAKKKKTHKRYFEVKILSLITLMSFHINKTVVSSKLSSLDFIKHILICFLKMNKGLTGLERHEGKLMTEFSFLGKLSL